MLVRTESNWKKKLSPEDEQKLNELLERTAVHREAYSLAEEVKAAQLWCAMMELKKENSDLRKRLGKLEYLLDGFVARAASIERQESEVVESHRRF